MYGFHVIGGPSIGHHQGGFPVMMMAHHHHPMMMMQHQQLVLGGAGGFPMVIGGGGVPLGLPIVCKRCQAGTLERQANGGGHRECTNCGRVVDANFDDVHRLQGHASSHQSRDDRLANGPTRTLYHQTDAASATAIQDSQKFKRGSDGSAGGGIYFAESASATNAKAHNHGVVLAATVQLGRIKTMSHPDSGITFSSLNSEGFDSVRVTCFNSGDEFVVYNYDQVSNIRRA